MTVFVLVEDYGDGCTNLGVYSHLESAQAAGATAQEEQKDPTPREWRWKQTSETTWVHATGEGQSEVYGDFVIEQFELEE